MGDTLEENPRNKSRFLFLLFTIFKVCRMYFVVWAYYFTPITALFLNLWFNFDVFTKQTEN